MAVKISSLPEVTQPTPTATAAVVDSLSGVNTTQKVKLSNIVKGSLGLIITVSKGYILR